MADDSRSSGEEVPRPAWVRLLIPSVADIIFVTLLGLLVFRPLAMRLLGDAGIGWHIRTGQEILATHTIPRVDLFSSTMRGQPWFAWEWLYDVIVGALETRMGLNGVVWFTAIVIAATFASTFRWLVSRGTDLFLAVGLVLLAASASMIHFLARPHVVSWLFTLAWLWILDSSERGHASPRALWLLPPLMLLWVNLHGGFLVAFVLLGVYWLSAVRNWLRGGDTGLDDLLLKLRAGRRARDLTVVGLVAGAVTFVNPYGWKLHAHIYQYLSNRFLMDHIDEFQSPNFHGAAQRCFAVLLLLVLVALAMRGRELRLSEGLVLIFAIYSGLYASRNIPVSAVLLVLVIGPLLGRAKARAGQHPAAQLSFSTRITAMEESVKGHLWSAVAVLFAGWIAGHGGALGATKLMDAHFDPARFPAKAVDFIQQSPDREAVLTRDAWGGYLIYRLYPQIPVVIDDRHDLYGEAFLKSYLKMIHLQPGWGEFLREHRVRRVLVAKGAPLANILQETPGWKVVYGDDVAVLFERDGTVAP